jgi:hypothetical protein
MHNLINQLNAEQDDYIYRLGRNDCILTQKHVALSIWFRKTAISVHNSADMPRALAEFCKHSDRHRPEHTEHEARTIGFERFEPTTNDHYRLKA